MKQLTAISGFVPYLFIVFFNAIVDSGHKITLQNTVFKSYDGPELIILTAFINALILMPFILLFSPSGFLSDKYPKNKIIQVASGAAIIITGLILFSYYLEMFWLSFGLTLILAVQTAFYAPAKFGLIKEMVGEDNLAMANGFVQAITIVSILLGSLVFSISFEYLLDNRSLDRDTILSFMMPIGIALIIFTVIEFILSFKLSSNTSVNKDLKFNLVHYGKGKYLKSNLKTLTSKESVWLAVIGLSIFWGLSQLLASVFGPHLKSTLQITNAIIPQALLALSALGIIIGSIYAGKSCKSEIELGIIPLGAAGVAISLFLLPTLSNIYLIGGSLFLYGFFAGMFIVPLNSLIQSNADNENLGTILAGHNFIQNGVMFLFLFMTSGFAYFAFSSENLIYVASAIALVGGAYTILKLKEPLLCYVRLKKIDKDLI